MCMREKDSQSLNWFKMQNASQKYFKVKQVLNWANRPTTQEDVKEQMLSLHPTQPIIRSSKVQFSVSFFFFFFSAQTETCLHTSKGYVRKAQSLNCCMNHTPLRCRRSVVGCYVAVGKKWSKMVKLGKKNGKKWQQLSNWSRIVKEIQKLSIMVKNGQKW